MGPPESKDHKTWPDHAFMAYTRPSRPPATTTSGDCDAVAYEKDASLGVWAPAEPRHSNNVKNSDAQRLRERPPLLRMARHGHFTRQVGYDDFLRCCGLQPRGRTNGHAARAAPSSGRQQERETRPRGEKSRPMRRHSRSGTAWALGGCAHTTEGEGKASRRSAAS